MMSPPSASPAQNDDSGVAAANGATPAHQRSYQACQSCRLRKVRCVLGSVDNPRPPPCNRCLREQKECVFAETRRKKRTNENENEEGTENWSPSADSQRASLSRNDSSSKRVRRSFANHGNAAEDDDGEGEGDGNSSSLAQQIRASIQGTPLSAHGSVHHRANGQARVKERSTAEEEVAAIQHPDVYSRDGFMGMLIKAAEQADINPVPTVQTTNDTLIDPAMSSGPAVEPPARQLAAWKRLKFVRSGWFKAREGIAYVEYFYRNLLPHTPLCLPKYTEVDKQITLLEQEKLLLVTILCIASRYMKLTGPAAVTRAAKIHDKLWTELHRMLGRLAFAQEQFGGGLCGAGAESKNVNQLAYRGMRTIGSIEALVILVEFNPRALHFPPEIDDEDFMLPEGDPVRIEDDDMSRMLVNGTGNEQKESWLEPLWRSDRMAWMQMSHAIALAMELGVFDDMSMREFCENNPGIPTAKVEAFWNRKRYLRELLPVYFIQLAGRLEFISKLPRGYIEALASKTGAEERIKNLLAVFRGAASPGMLPGSSPGTSYKDFSDPQQVLLYFWQEIAAIMKSVNQEIYKNGQMSAPLVKSGRYAELIDLYQGPLDRWQRDLAECCAETDHITPRMRHILNIEYETARVHINAIAVQAVIERCINNIPQQRQNLTNGFGSSGKGGNPRKRPPVPPAMLEKWSGDDRKYIKEVIAGGRNVLRIVVDDLLPGEALKHIPVRTYSRILGVYIILLKAFFLYGSLEPEAHELFTLINRAFDAMGTCVVDDLHISNQFSAMGKSLLNRVTSKLIRISANGNVSSGAISPRYSRGRTPVVNNSSGTGGPSANMFMPAQGHGLGSSNGLAPVDGSLMMHPGDFVPQNSTNLLPFQVNEYDPSLHSVMPPPGLYNVNGQFENNYTDNDAATAPVDDSAAFMIDNTDQNWIMGELGELFGNPDIDVTSTHFGPAVNGMDLLDTLAPPVEGN